MDSTTGILYPSKARAISAGVAEKNIVELFGEFRAIKRVARKVRMASKFEHARRKVRRRMQEASRRRNRSS